MGLKKYKTIVCFLLLLYAIMMLLRHYVRKSPQHGSDDRSESMNHYRATSVNCLQNPNKKLAIIVPFRERFNQLLAFVPHMDAFLDRQQICHEFFIMNQVDEYRFNRGQLVNVGFLFAANQSDYIAIHDVDLLPLNDHLSYSYPSDGIFHVSSPQLHPKYHYEKFIGGIVLVQNKVFDQVNGFSNVYWGWGLEDDEFYTRLFDANIKIRRPVGIRTDSSNTFAHLHNDREHKRDTAKLFNQREVTRRKDRRTGLNTVEYELVKVHHITISDIPVRIYDIALKCDREVTPWCAKPVPSAGKSNRPRKVQDNNTAEKRNEDEAAERSQRET